MSIPARSRSKLSANSKKNTERFHLRKRVLMCCNVSVRTESSFSILLYTRINAPGIDQVVSVDMNIMVRKSPQSLRRKSCEYWPLLRLLCLSSSGGGHQAATEASSKQLNATEGNADCEHRRIRHRSRTSGLPTCPPVGGT